MAIKLATPVSRPASVFDEVRYVSLLFDGASDNGVERAVVRFRFARREEDDQGDFVRWHNDPDGDEQVVVIDDLSPIVTASPDFGSLRQGLISGISALLVQLGHLPAIQAEDSQ